MESSPVYLTGDVHLGAVPAETEKAFVAWLEHCGREASRVVINGDLFDFWFEYGTVVPRGHTRVLGALASLVDSGMDVLLMGGNHDWWGGSFLTQEIGLDFRQEAINLELAGHTTFLAHGDGVGSGDPGYRALKFLLRGWPTRFAFRWLHPDLGAAIARRVSQTEGRAGEPIEKQEARARALEAWALEKLRARPELDLVVLGHTHIPVLREASPGRHYLNAGDWVANQSYAVIPREGPPCLLDWRAARKP